MRCGRVSSNESLSPGHVELAFEWWLQCFLLLGMKSSVSGNPDPVQGYLAHKK